MTKSFASVLVVAGLAVAGAAITPAQAAQHHGWHGHHGGWHGDRGYHRGWRHEYRSYGYAQPYYGRPYYGGYNAGPPCIPVLGVVTGNFCNYY